MDILAETGRDREVLNIKINPNLLSSSEDIPKALGRKHKENAKIQVLFLLICLFQETDYNEFLQTSRGERGSRKTLP